ncbi:MAG: hypothetical protein ACKO9F_06010, partial [Caldilinea sp.]
QAQPPVRIDWVRKIHAPPQGLHSGSVWLSTLVLAIGALAHLISKLHGDSALYFEYVGEQKQSGPRRRYGDKIDYRAIPERYLMETTQDKGIRTTSVAFCW